MDIVEILGAVVVNGEYNLEPEKVFSANPFDDLQITKWRNENILEMEQIAVVINGSVLSKRVPAAETIARWFRDCISGLLVKDAVITIHKIGEKPYVWTYAAEFEQEE